MIEVMIAAAILAIVSLGVLALFFRSMQHNISGFDSNEATRHASADLESLLALTVDDRRFDFADPLPGHLLQPSSIGVGGEEMHLGDWFWDEGAEALIPSGSRRQCNMLAGTAPQTIDGSTDCFQLGQGNWVVTPEDAKGLVFWQRRSVVRQYTYADISDGVIDQSGTQLVTLGHSQIFDRPLIGAAPASSSHFKEKTVELKSERVGMDTVAIEVAQLDETTMRLGPGGQRTRLVRTF